MRIIKLSSIKFDTNCYTLLLLVSHAIHCGILKPHVTTCEISLVGSN